MKIVIVTHNLASGGAERVISQLVTAWSANGVECSLIFTDGEEVFYKIPESIPVFHCSPKSRSKLVQKISVYKKVRKIIQEVSPDVVLSLPEEVGIFVGLALLGTKIPVVVSERNNPEVMPYKKVTRFLRGISYRHVAGIIFQTQQQMNFFSKKIQRKSAIIPNPLDLTRLPDPYRGVREKVIVGAGRLEPQKNFSLLIRSFSVFYNQHKDYKLIIYGEGKLHHALQEQIDMAGLPTGTIVLQGRVADLPRAMNKASLFVLSSDYEGMPNVLIEAMSCGIPSISTDCPVGGSAEIIEDGKTGLLVPVNDVEKLASAMSDIIDHKICFDSFYDNSFKIRKKLDSNIISDQWLQFLISKK